MNGFAKFALVALVALGAIAVFGASADAGYYFNSCYSPAYSSCTSYYPSSCYYTQPYCGSSYWGGYGNYFNSCYSIPSYFGGSCW